MKISVCMATYNGARYVKAQMTSILKQLQSGDEVVVVDDCSTDNTLEILRALNDSRIVIFVNDRNMGFNFSFARAISLARNELIFLSDQDDIWLENRVPLMAGKLADTGAMLVSSNFDFMDIDGKSTHSPVDGVNSSDSHAHFKNILDIFIGKTNYYGCAMAFRKDLTKLILPMPSIVESHDLWIALAANLIAANSHLDDKTLIKRIHDRNATKTNRWLIQKVWARVIFLISIVILLSRARHPSTNPITEGKQVI